MILILKNFLFTILVPGTVAVYVPWIIVRHRSPVGGLTLTLAAALLALGGTTYAWCLWDFARTGHGTPAPIDPPKKLVVRGLYCYTRNPMYLGVLTVILGWAALFESAALIGYAACVGLVFHLVVVLYEERHLRRVFGGDYEQYCAQVPRWLPGPRRQRPAE